ERLAQTGQETLALKRREVAVVAGLGEDALDDHRVGDERPSLGDLALVLQQRGHRLRELFVEEPLVARRPEAGDVVGLADLVEEATEEVGVLALLPEERGEEELVLEAALVRRDEQQREQIEDDRLLAGLEEGGDAQEQVALRIREADPLLLVAG